MAGATYHQVTELVISVSYRYRLIILVMGRQYPHSLGERYPVITSVVPKRATPTVLYLCVLHYTTMQVSVYETLSVDILLELSKVFSIRDLINLLCNKITPVDI